MINFFTKKNETAKEALLQALKALDVMPEIWRAKSCSFKTDIRVDVNEQYRELQLYIIRTVKGRDTDLSRSPLAYRCHGIKAMPAKESLRMIVHPKVWQQDTRLSMKLILVQCGLQIFELQLRLYADSFKSGVRDFLLLLFFKLFRSIRSQTTAG